MKNLKTKILLLTILIAFSQASIKKVDAKAAGNKFSLCSLAVFPYSPPANESVDEAGNQYINKLAGDICSTFLKYPPQSATQFPQNKLNDPSLQVKSGSDNQKVPITKHIHEYFNDSLEDSDNTPADNLYYKSFVKAFEITLQQDSKDNMENVVCDYPYPSYIPDEFKATIPTTETVKQEFADCDGYVPVMWGGTKVKKSNDGVITWTFGVDNNNWLPVFFGDNPSIESLIGLDTSSPENRKFTFSVNLETKNLSAKATPWSATTTSKVLLRNMGISKNAVSLLPPYGKYNNACSAPGAYNTGWCSLPVLAGYQNIASLDGKNLPANFFWFPIGSVATIWKAPVQQKLDCLDLSFAQGSPTSTKENEDATFTVSPIYANQAGTKRSLKYAWYSLGQGTPAQPWMIKFVANNSFLNPFVQIAFAAVDNGNPSAIDPNVLNNSGNQIGLPKLISIGKFKDQKSTVQSFNPFLDSLSDTSAYYTGGSANVMVGVQAFYADVPQNTPVDNVKFFKFGNEVLEKAPSCHLEYKIPASPVSCIGLTISPNQLGANTPITFTVTPKFNPADKSIPLNYIWQAQKNAGNKNGQGGGNASGIKEVWDDITKAVPNNVITGDSENGNPNWFGKAIKDAGDITLQNVSNLYMPYNPVDPGPELNLQNLNSFGQTNLLAVQVPSNSGTTINQNININGVAQQNSVIDPNTPGVLQPVDPNGTPDVNKPNLNFGKFRNAEFDLNDALKNPYTEIVDNKTYYTGGPGGTLITVKGVGKKGETFDLCKASLVIPEQKICLKLTTEAKDQQNNLVDIKNLQPNQTYTLGINQAQTIFNDNPATQIPNYTMKIINPKGVGEMTNLDPANCPSAMVTLNKPSSNLFFNKPIPASCKYSYKTSPGDVLTMSAVPDDGVAACNTTVTIPQVPSGKICLKLTTEAKDQQNNLVDLTTLQPNQTYTLGINQAQTIFNDNPATQIPNYTMKIINSKGVGEMTNLDPVNCPNAIVTLDKPSSNLFFNQPIPANCKYSYKPNPTDILTMSAVPDDGVAACSTSVTVSQQPPTAKPYCESLNFSYGAQYTSNPQISPGESKLIQVNPLTNEKLKIPHTHWMENGDGHFAPNPDNLNYGSLCPIPTSDFVAPSICSYYFVASSQANSNNNFAVEAVYQDFQGNSIDKNPNNQNACLVKSSNFIPPKEKPYCLYLDLDYNPEPYTDGSKITNLTAVAVLSDGSKYQDKIAFQSNDGNGQFSGGFSPVSGSNTNFFKSSTDNTNSTKQVTFSNGQPSTGINIFLADTNIEQSAACQRNLRPSVTPPSKECVSPIIKKQPNNSTYCVELPANSNYNSNYCWTIQGANFLGGLNTETGKCVTVPNSPAQFSLHVEDCGAQQFRNICYDDYAVENNPKIKKEVKKDNSQYARSISYSTNGSDTEQSVIYKITYSPGNIDNYKKMNVVIKDTIGNFGYLKGKKNNTESSNGQIKYLDQLSVRQDNTEILPCNLLQNGDELTNLCYIGNINEQSGITIQNVKSSNDIIVEYITKLHSGLLTEECQNGQYCNERYVNTSAADVYYCTNEDFNSCSMDKQIISNETKVDIVCKYLLTRASGDVFLEDQLKYGVDISKCYPFKNVSSTIIKPLPEKPQQLGKTGSGVEVNINHEICSKGQQGFAAEDLNLPASMSADEKQKALDELNKLYGSKVTDLSSQICEIGIIPASDLTSETIRDSLEKSMNKLTRWSGVNPPNTINSFADLKNSAQNRIYYYQGNGNDTVTIKDLNIPEGSGAWTIIVKNAHLHIENNIEYTTGITPVTSKDIASLAIVVWNDDAASGNKPIMSIDKAVTELGGAYFIQNGKVISGNLGNPVESEQPLTIYGSMYGDIGPLFKDRTYAEADEGGAITIRYDQRIIQNPPTIFQGTGIFSQAETT